MKNPLLKSLARKVALQTINEGEEKNICVSSKEVQEVRETLGGARGEICHNLGPNRAARRAELKKERYKAAHNGKSDQRPFVNNRGGNGYKVFEKMAYFHMSVGGKRHGL